MKSRSWSRRNRTVPPGNLEYGMRLWRIHSSRVRGLILRSSAASVLVRTAPVLVGAMGFIKPNRITTAYTQTTEDKSVTTQSSSVFPADLSEILTRFSELPTRESVFTSLLSGFPFCTHGFLPLSASLPRRTVDNPFLPVPPAWECV